MIFPLFFFMNEMLGNGLDISLQDSEVSYLGWLQELVMENYVLVYRFNTEDTSFVLYTEN